ncbi:hypothetical protein GKC29_25360 [Micromonospora sp. WMMC415]|uniref:hypothetical protein n=1 Tax=Micromonospora sp. WMMC415 TaxID=2675222 RepID=UPI0012B461B4|nr:hypothetical protein [Micromonospora sp. WMMC415]QGN49823.1 hypothetical protein GKC29_25360 [Micromonospora sp. WMMC415]
MDRAKIWGGQLVGRETERGDGAIGQERRRSDGCHAAPARFLWCPSPWAALEHLQHLVDHGHTPLVDVVRRMVLNRSLSVARAPLWQRASETERGRAFGDFHSFMEREGYYGEQRYDGMDERYDLMERPYQCRPSCRSNARRCTPVLRAVRQAYDLVLSPMWRALGQSITGRYTLHPAWYWDNDHGFVDQNDDGRAVVRYSLPDLDDRSPTPPGATTPTWSSSPRSTPTGRCSEQPPTPRGRDAEMPRWRPAHGGRSRTWRSSVNGPRPTSVKLDEQGRLHANDGPAVSWPDGHQMWARQGRAEKASR